MVTLNVDIGELADEPEELYRIATVVNVACGGHAGDAASMARAVTLAREAGAEIAAHPSYPDREGFGRTTMAIAPEALRASIESQCAALQAIAGGSVRAVKLHGALYHDAARDPVIAEAVLRGAMTGLGVRPADTARGDRSDATEPPIGGPLTVVREGATMRPADLAWVGPSHGAIASTARAAGLAYVREAFADRGILPNGSLIPRGQPGALIVDPERAAAQAVALARAGDADTLCVHSDTPNAVAIARAVRRALDAEGLLRSVRGGSA